MHRPFLLVQALSNSTIAATREWYSWVGRPADMTFDKIERLLVRSVLMIGMLLELVKLAMFEISKK